MNMHDLIKKLRTPSARKQAAQAQAAAKAAQVQASVAVRESKYKKRTFVLAGIVTGAFLVTLFSFFSVHNQAEDIASRLDPQHIQGLRSEADFNPNAGIKYIYVQEGHDRSVAVAELGSTIPVISRFNYKTFNKNSYKIIGQAPWAITNNIASNLNDPDLLKYLLGNEDMIQAFLARPDVASVLNDPQALYQLATDPSAIKEFIEEETVHLLLANEKALRAVANSRWMSYILISKAVKNFRDRPQQAAQIINQNPYLKELKEMPAVRRSMLENRYLKDIAPTLLK